jgi:ABC-2 type transport system permease protein
MRKVFILAKTLLKSGGGIASARKKGRQWWVPLLLGFAFLSFGFSVGMMALGLYDTLAPVGAQGVILPLAMGATSVVIFIFGIFYTVSVMYHADDVSLLLALPLKPWQILGAKFLNLVVYEYIFEAFIMLPILVVYGIKSASGAPYIIYSIILFAILPAIALSMASVLVMIVMRFTSFGKNKQAFKFVGGIIALVLALGFNVGLQSAANQFSPEQLAALANGSSSLVTVVERIFPGVPFASRALIGSGALSGLWNLLLFLLCSAAAVGVFLALGQWLYFKGLAGVTEAGGKRRLLTAEELGKGTAGTSATRSYVGKELKMLTRSPIAFLNCVVMNFIWPVLVLVMIMSRGESLSMLSASIGGFNASGILAIVVGIGVFLSSANAITSTAISREGKQLYFMKYIPMPIKKQLMAKVYTGMLLSAFGIVLLAVLAVIVGVDLLTALLALVLSLLAMSSGALVGLLIDAARPKLDWINEQQAIKQNLNVMLHMLVGLLMAAAVIVPVLILNMTLAAAAAYIAVLLGLLTLLFWRGMRGAAARIEAMDA